MGKWHNGKNGPSPCRATKGRCPFGGDESHFEHKEDAQKAFDKENEASYGILPTSNESNGKLDRSKMERKVLIASSHGIPMAMSNYAYTGQGTQADTEHFKSIIEDRNMSAKEIADALNKDPKINGKWETIVNEETKKVIKVTDGFGNVSKLSIVYKEPEKKPVDPNRAGNTLAFGEKTRIPMSLSNYVSLGPGGRIESERYFKNLTKENWNDPKALVRKLNKDERIFGKYNLVEENNNYSLIKVKDAFGNVSNIRVMKNELKTQEPNEMSPLKLHSANGNERTRHHTSEVVNVHNFKDHAEAEQFLSDLTKGYKGDPEALVKELNANKNIYGKWKISVNNPDNLTLECKNGKDKKYLRIM